MIRFAKRLRSLWRRRELDRDLEDELLFHQEMKAQELGDAAEAQRRIGNATAFKESCRDLWSFSGVETWWQDVRYAARALAKTPGFTMAAIIALALGIGADTAVFTIATGVFTWDMGLDHPNRIVWVSMKDPSRDQEFEVSYPDFCDLRAQTKSLAGLAAYSAWIGNVSGNSNFAERTFCVAMSANGFAVSEQKPLLGRTFVPDDERNGAPPVVVLAHRLWQDRYGSDPRILGKTLRIDDVSRTVVGVMPVGKDFPEDTELWVPMIPTRAMEDRATRSLGLFGRLAPGVTMARARMELVTIAARLAKQYPATNRGLTANVVDIAVITGVHGMRPIFVAMWVAVGFVLLIACADVANMLLARGAGRAREISIRVAIGAGRLRIIRQLLIESVLLSLGGGLLGWLVALGGLRWFDVATAGRPGGRPPWLHLTIDTTAFAYLAIVSIGTGILFGLAPALRLARVDVHSALKDGGQSVAGARRGLSASNFLVAAEMTLCIVLLAGAGLMIRSVVNLYGAPIGVDSRNVLTMHVNPSEAKYPRPSDRLAFYSALTKRLGALPGVESAAVVSNLPYRGSRTVTYQLEGTNVDPARLPETDAIVAGAAYFNVMRVKARRGRLLAESDGIAGTPVALVNETFARKFWPHENAVGRHLRLWFQRAPQPWVTVVGVVPDILQDWRPPLDHDPLIYLPYAEEPERDMSIAARTTVPPGTLANAFRRTVESMDPNLATFDVYTLEERLSESRFSARILGGMFSVFAVIALVLATVGLYAVIAHSTAERTQEIGVRMALGGGRRDILRLVLAQGLRPIAAGLALGLPAAFGVTHVLRMTLIGVSPGDPLTFSMVVLVLAAAGALGCAVPARRAMKVDPLVALRYE